MRLGLAILGIGIIYLGFYLQREGFQSGSGSQGSTPSLESTFNNADVLVGNLEITNKYKLIQKNKDSADKILAKYISDADIFLKLDLMYTEVQSYVENGRNIAKATHTASDKVKPDIQTLNFLNKEYVNILFKVYVTFPALMLSSDSNGQTTYDAIVDENVLAHIAEMIDSELKIIPSSMTLITNMQATLLADANALKASVTDNMVETMKTNMATYSRLVSQELAGLKKYHKLVLAANLPAKVSSAKGDITSFLKNTIQFVTSIQTIVTGIPTLNKSLVSAVASQLTIVNSYLDESKSMEGFQSFMNPYEGFQSKMNPYVLTSSVAQGIEFRS
jgi:hypothetical protein